MESHNAIQKTNKVQANASKTYLYLEANASKYKYVFKFFFKACKELESFTDHSTVLVLQPENFFVPIDVLKTFLLEVCVEDRSPQCPGTYGCTSSVRYDGALSCMILYTIRQVLY